MCSIVQRRRDSALAVYAVVLGLSGERRLISANAACALFLFIRRGGERRRVRCACHGVETVMWASRVHARIELVIYMSK